MSGPGDNVTFRDFSKKRKEIYFTIDDVRYDCVKALGLKKLQTVIKIWRDKGSDVNESNVLERVTGVMQFFLKPGAFAAFELLVNDEDADDPIDIEQITEIVHWLMEVYTVRPTESPSNSSSSSPIDGDGTSSTDGAPHEPSIR